MWSLKITLSHLLRQISKVCFFAKEQEENLCLTEGEIVGHVTDNVDDRHGGGMMNYTLCLSVGMILS